MSETIEKVPFSMVLLFLCLFLLFMKYNGIIYSQYS